MKKILASSMLLVAAFAAQPAQALSAYLVETWYDGGNTFCKYSNGTILNVGAKVCPMSIQY